MEIMKDMMIDIEAERFNEWLEENYPDVVPTLKNGSRPRTCITGSRRRLLIRLSGIMNTGCSGFPERCSSALPARKTGAEEARCPAR
jgi:hypothetical protein